jgi:hypothetical protein
MFGTIRKHQTWLWFTVIAFTIVGMVMWQNGPSRSGNERRPGDLGSIDGKPITPGELQSAKNEATLMYFLRNREWPDNVSSSRYDSEREMYQRLFLLRRLDTYNIHSDPDAAAQLAGLILRQFGQGQTVPLDAFVEQILRPHGLTAEDFQNFLEHDISIQQLVAVVGASGKLMTPAEIQSFYVQDNQESAAEAVFFSASNYLARIQEPTPEALGQFYTNQQASYREPDQMQLTYVFFNVTNFMPQAEQQLGTNLVRASEEALTRLGTNAFRYGKTPEESRAKIRELLIMDTAISNANAKAVAFQNEVVTKGVPNLAAVAKEHGLEAKVTKPFDKEFGPGELNLGPSYPVASLFNLTPEDPIVPRPVQGLDGMYVLAYDKMIPSRIPPLEEIRSRVQSDYKFVEAMRLAQLDGRAFSQTVTNELAHGKTFAETCAATRVKPVEVKPFSAIAQRIPEVEDRADVGTFKEVVARTPVGSASSFVPTRDGGFVAYVRQRLPIDQAKMKAELPEYSKNLRQRRESEAFEIWFTREASTALRDIPALRRQLPMGR